MLEKWGRGGCLECEDSHRCMRAINDDVTRTLFAGPLPVICILRT